MNWIESHLLTLVTFLPVIGAVLVALLPRGEGGQVGGRQEGGRHGGRHP